MQGLSIEGFRLSPQQKRLWLLQQAGESQAYRAQCAILIEGKLNRQSLELALEKVVDRNEILRTRFQALPEMNFPLQVITNNSISALRYYDLTELVPEEQTVEIEALFQASNFDNQSSLDIKLVRISPEKHILLVCLPVLNADWATVNNLVCEISSCYTAILENQELPEPSLQYVDIAEWQNELFEGEEAELGRDYWRKNTNFDLAGWQLSNENTPAVESKFIPKHISFVFDSEIVAQLEIVANKYNCSISTIFQACWHILLWRLTKRSDVVVGSYCDGRNYEELESALGLLAKYLPINCHLEAKFNFGDVLKHIEQSTNDALKWQESFTWEKDLSLSFFPFCFEFEEQPAKYSAADVLFSISKQYVCIDQFKVKLSCLRRDDFIITEFHYDSNLFGREDIERLAREFQTLLKSVIDKPEAAISELEILSASDRQQLLIEFNNTQTNYAKDQCIHQLFEQQAARTPNGVAVVFENQQLTYAQLNARANQLAHHLKKLGVGCETVVALCIDRSLDLLVGLLGILKAGAAYLPLDPVVPKERLTFMVQDAEVALILTHEHLVEQFSAQAAPLICLDTDWEVIAQHSDENPLNEVMLENLVYVIYTSGSTGKPKGVAVEHRQILNYLHGILEKLDLPEGSTFGTVSTFAADLGNTAIFPTLCTGGCLHVISQERATSPEALADYCDRYPLDCLKIVPSHLNALLSASSPEKILPRKYLILGGEALSWQLVEKIQRYKPSCQILNHYGPTETTVGVLTYPIKDESSRDQTETVPIGRPLANTQIYILDEHLQPVPLGVPGELHIGGDSLTRGYFNQPERTADKFMTIERLGGEEAHAIRVYKTGDLARYLPDRNIEFLGRIDDQVKIHGFRIELQEIESLLSQHPAISATVVLAREDELGHKRLVAYLVASQNLEQSGDLRNFLKEKLPEYMIPSVFVTLKALPLTPNGKVDRQALPAPDQVKPEWEGRFVAPRTANEEIIAKIWAEVLGRNRIGIYDNFFELGGDSILSIQIVARVNQAGLQLTPKQLFESPTVAGLAASVGTASTLQAEQETVTGAIPLTPIQHWFFQQKLSDLHHWNQALLLEVREAVVPALLKQALQHLLKHHDALRLRFTSTKSGWQQVNAGLDAVEIVPFSSINLSGVSAAEQAIAFEATANQLQASLNLSEGSLLQVALFDFGNNQPQRLLIVIHHLAVDGISWRILLEDLQQVYEQLSQGKAVQLPPKTFSFQQWSKLLQEYARSEWLQQERDYWLRSPDHFCLPRDNPNGANTVALAQTVSVSLSVEQTRALLQEVPSAYRTQVNDILLTALVQTFTQWTGEHSLLVDLEGHGREAIGEDIDLSRTVGWLTTIFPVLLTWEGNSNLGEALKAIKEQLRGIPNRGIGYGILRYLSEDVAVNMSQAEVRFNYLGQFDQVLPESSLFKLVYPAPGMSRSPRGERYYLLDIIGFVLEGQLQLEWTYSEQIYQRTTVERLAQGFVEALRSLITHCQSSAGGYTASDFPEANLSQKNLEQFLTKINRGSKRAN